MYLMRFLDVTMDLHIKIHQDTSGYMYLGLFITIHQDTPRYKITIHVSWGCMRTTYGIHKGYMYLQRFEDT